MYADDTSLSYKFKDLTLLIEAVNDDLRNLETLLKVNKISLNVAKTHSMLICAKSKHRSIKNSDETFCLKIRDKSLDILKKTKYFGCYFELGLPFFPSNRICVLFCELSDMSFLRITKTSLVI